MKKLRKICLLLLLGVVAYLVFWILRYEYYFGYHFPEYDFVDNGKNEPYAQGVPLHEMDFTGYLEQMPISTLTYWHYENMLILPCDVEYYTRKEDEEPVIILEKGMEVCVTPGVNGFSDSLDGYGLVCWPDYQEEWRYGYPLITEDIPFIREEHQMYYVKSEQLEEIVKVFYKNNKDSLLHQSTPWAYPKVLTQYLDRILYNNGAFCPERWK